MADVVVKYIKGNPKDRHLNAATIAALAFKDACPALARLVVATAGARVPLTI